MGNAFSIHISRPGHTNSHDKRSLQHTFKREDHGSLSPATDNCDLFGRTFNSLDHKRLLTADAALLLLIALLLMCILFLWLHPDRIPGSRGTLLAPRRRKVAAFTAWVVQVATYLSRVVVWTAGNEIYCSLGEKIPVSRIWTFSVAFFEMIAGGCAAVRYAKREVEEANGMEVEMQRFGQA